MTMGTLTQMLSLVSPHELQDLQEICEYNDISEEQLICAPETITQIEMFMQGIPQICCMSYFPNLVSLSLTHQNIPSIEGLHNCSCLRILRLNENVIDRIDGLQNCTRLVELYLHSNKIRYIKNISHLRDLKVLWLANNNIHQIEGLGDCTQLKELNLAKNPINKLGDILSIKSLEKLNVAATNIGSFKEITKLRKLKMLKDLRFLDYQWGKSPISFLHNYQTYVLFRLPNLCVLDAEHITEEDRQAAKTTYTRKRVYYNMCIKSLRHRRNDIFNISSMKEVKQISSLNRKFSELSKSRKDLEKDFFKYFEPGSDGQKKKSSDGYLTFSEKAKSLDSQLFSIIKQIDSLRKELQENRLREQENVDLWIHWVMVELDTGGNIRMEVGGIDQIWYKNCIELVTSRFSADDFAPFGIIGLEPRKVSRVHNRFLQDRFQRKIETKVESKHVEYLLYGETFQGSGELQLIVEEGFPFQSSESKSDAHVPVLLSNSIGLADICRLQVIFDQSQKSNFSKMKLNGWVLIVKAYLGVSVQDQHVNDEFVNFSKLSYPDADSVYRIHPYDPTQRSWHIFDSSMLVPEYLVEYEYLLRNEPSGNNSKEKDGSLVKGKFVLPTSKLMSRIDIFIDGQHSVKVNHHSSDIKEFHCNSTHTPQKNPKYEFLNVTHLNLHNSNIHELGPLKLLRKLKVLVLSFNKILHTGPEFQELEELEILDLSYNLLRQIKGFIYLKQLKTLDLAGNQICTMDEVQSLAHQVSQLLHLNLRGNPIEEFLSYRDTVLTSFLYLTEFDCLPVDFGTLPHDKKKRVEDVSKRGRKKTSNNEGLYQDLYGKTQVSPEPTANHYDADTEELYFEYQNLKSMTGFEKLSNIRKLVLSGNKISSLEGLDRCTLLEELILEDNCIKQVKESMQLPMLWKLDLGRNEMTSCLQLHCFSGLSQLSIENNKIESLKGLSSLTALLELYAAHNLLRDADEFSHLQVLPKLMVLDLSGNPLCEDPDYRSYAIFTLRKLKVLDSRVVDGDELALAHERHVGRLTKEMLQDFLGNCAFENLKTLNLSGKGLRNCGKVFESQELLGLEELDLSNNSLASIKSLKFLRNLKMLLLQNNVIKDGPLLEENIYNEDPAQSSVLITHGTKSSASNDVVSVMSKYGENICLSMVEVLHLDSNSITNIMYLGLQKYFPNLRLLSLKSNAIAKIDGLSGLVFLQKLYLDHNCIKEIEIGSFENLPNLEELHLSDNAIRTVQHLWHLTSLKTLNLSLNYIKSDRQGGFQVTKELAALNMLEDLSLSENPICRHPQYRCTVINALLQLTSLDGCVITEEDLVDAELYANGGSNRIRELIQQDNSLPHQNEFQSSSSVSSSYQGLHGKVVLKAKPFNFDAMSCAPKTTPQGFVHRLSLDFTELTNNSNTYRSGTPRTKARLEGDHSRGSVPPGLMRNFRKFN